MMAPSTTSSIMESLFQRTLDDLIKTIRSQILSEPTIISKSISEIRKELKSTDLQTKSTALEKLTYLNSLYFIDMSFASFHVVEVMSSPKFIHKRIGYLAASQSFHDHTDVMLLITNQMRKDMNSGNEFEVSLALECFSIIANIDLARDLTSEVFMLLGSTKLYVKKKAIGVILRLFGRYPDSVKVVFKRLVENLDSFGDQNLLSAVIGVFCELTTKDPKSYLPLAPEFYRILVDSKNNWVLIKVMKIFGKLGVFEPRLAKRIVDPVCDHMRRTTAKSLMFECIRTVVVCLSEYEMAVKLAVEKVKELLNDEDQNLKYLGLKALSILGSKHLWAVVENKEAVIKSLSDADPNIRHESLHLVMDMVSEDNVSEMCRVLVNYALKSDPEFCNEILGSVLATCSRSDYEVVVDFDWYVSLLGEIARNPHCHKGEEIERQLVDIGQRVREARPQLVHVARDLLIDPALLGNPFLHRTLSAAAWVSGEYVEFTKNPFGLAEALLQPRTNLLPPLIRAVYIQSAFKVFVFCFHSFFVRKKTTLSSSFNDLSRLAKREDSFTSFDCEQDEVLNLGLENRTGEDLALENGEDSVGQSSFSASIQNDPFTRESINGLINMIKMSLGPLSGSDEVEVQERARNVLGLVELIQRETSCFVEKEGSFKEEELQALKIIETMHNAFSEEIGPVSVTSQERVPVPEGLILNDNLVDLDSICGDILSPPSSSFSMGNRLFGEIDTSSPLDLQREGDSEQSNESTSLLAQHRKRHGLYYLAAEKNEMGSNDYPPPNDLQSTGNINDSTQDLLKLTEQSLVSKKKANHSKPRPVVVKLDDGDEKPVSDVKPLKELEEDQLSGAVRNILLGEEGNPSSSQSKPSEKSSGKRRVKDVLPTSEHTSHPRENLSDLLPEVGTSSRRSKHRSHGKERNRSPKNNDEGNQGNPEKDKKKSHRHSRNKTRQRADLPLNVVAQTPVIPDFLFWDYRVLDGYSRSVPRWGNQRTEGGCHPQSAYGVLPIESLNRLNLES
ncbi:hypothetical protein IFM89_020711 [Coptis chinensis]|uniref:AP-3 complex subunit delta n=1 Tax=Coptis chinensis TaxID=261450 RepID=A0A835LMZ5_9MAGN|nr:hypothetical protein IFM89_020711 [Coptis chinensis]